MRSDSTGSEGQDEEVTELVSSERERSRQEADDRSAFIFITDLLADTVGPANKHEVHCGCSGMFHFTRDDGRIAWNAFEARKAFPFPTQLA